MQRLFQALVVFVVLAGVAAYLFIGPATLQRVAAESLDAFLFRAFGIPITPIRRLERWALVVREERDTHRRNASDLAAEIAESEVFQKQLEEIAVELGKSEKSTEVELLREKLRLFLLYRDRIQQLAELDQKIQAGITKAKIAQLAGLTERVNTIVEEVEEEIKKTVFLTPTPEDILPVLPTPEVAATGTLTATATITATVTATSTMPATETSR